jgi:hypothetical protein
VNLLTLAGARNILNLPITLPVSLPPSMEGVEVGSNRHQAPS